MKIINVNHDPERVKAEREASLVEYLQRLQIETGRPRSESSQFARLRPEQKEQYRNLLEESHALKSLMKANKEESELLALLKEAGFPSFGRLPKELRLLVWKFASLEYDYSRVHVFDLKRRGLKSNQPIPPLLRVCRLSRVQYIATLGCEFAFGAYINFANDVIYIPKLPNIGQIDVVYDGFISRILHHQHSSKIQRLALGHQIFCAFDWLDFKYVAESLDTCGEFCVVLDDTRSAQQMSLDVDSSFIYLSAKQQRTSGQIGYTRMYGNFVRGILSNKGVQLPRFKYGLIDNSQYEETMEEGPVPQPQEAALH